MKDMKAVGAHLRTLRNAAGLSLPAAAEKTGMPAVVIGSYERADRRPGVDQLAKVYAAYGYELRAVPFGATVVEGPVPAATVLTDEQIAVALRSLADHLAPGGAES